MIRPNPSSHAHASGKAPLAPRPWRHTVRDIDGRDAAFRSGYACLRDMDLFSPVSDGELAQFAALGRERRVEKGESLPCGAEGSRPLALILEGEAVLASGCGAAATLLRALEPGDLLGEIALFDGGWGGATHAGIARPLTTLRLMEWERGGVLEALRRWPDVALGLLSGMARRQRDLHRRLEGLGNQRAPRRLARALSGLLEDHGAFHRDAAGRRGLVLRGTPSRRRLAEMAGMARETASRLLLEWERCGWVAAGSRGELLILDPEKLGRLAGTET